MQTSIKSIFEPEPQRWGLRGDPMLWQELKQAFSGDHTFNDEKAFEQALYIKAANSIGEPIEQGKIIYIPRFDPGHGMSRGKIDCSFWIDEGFPLLIARFKLLISDSETKIND